VRWILDPPAMKPATAMPVVGLTEAQARDAVAYLWSLE
jgi:cytochrome c